MKRVVLAALVAGWAGVAAADGFEASRHHSVTSETGVFAQDTAATLPKRRLDVAASVDFAHKALVARERSTGDELTLVGNRVTTHLTAGFGITERIEAGIEVPLILSQSGDFLIDGKDLTATALGDVHVVGKARVIERGPAALAARILLGLPTGSEKGLTGGGTSFGIEALAGYARGKLAGTLAAGYLARGGGRLEGLTVDDEITLGAAAAFEVRERFWALAEATLALGVQGDGAASERPAELIAGARFALASGLRVQGGLGVGLGEGYGTPDVRVIVAVGWGRGGVEAAPSRIEITTAEPVEPVEPTGPTGPIGPDEPVPAADRDGDGVPDMSDLCVDEPGVAAEKGCPAKLAVGPAPAADGDGDGVADDVDRCPAEPEDKDGASDGDGCPDLDNDLDGIPDTVDACPDETEVMNGNNDDDGCPDAGAALVTIEGSRIVLGEPVKFAAKKATIQAVSHKVLTTLGKVLLFHPEIQRVKITSTAKGQSPLLSQGLGVQRAEAVRRYLIENLGVEEERLLAAGVAADKAESVEVTIEKRE